MVQYQFEIDDKTWHAFKQKLNKNITIKEAVVALIEAYNRGIVELHPERRFDGRRR